MRLRRIPQALPQVHSHPLVTTERETLHLAGHWRQLFAKEQPLHLEIGMGRGRFLTMAAAAHPEYNYLGLERRAECLLSSLARLAEPYPANLRLLHADASLLAEMFAPGELDAIYLQFSDPWPKSRHAKRRLTSAAFLNQYQGILQPAGVLIFKTDGAAFYHWSCENFAAAGWHKNRANENWPAAADGAASEYELRFRRLSLPIYYAEFSPPAQKTNQSLHK